MTIKMEMQTLEKANMLRDEIAKLTEERKKLQEALESDNIIRTGKGLELEYWKGGKKLVMIYRGHRENENEIQNRVNKTLIDGIKMGLDYVHHRYDKLIAQLQEELEAL